MARPGHDEDCPAGGVDGDVAVDDRFNKDRSARAGRLLCPAEGHTLAIEEEGVDVVSGEPVGLFSHKEPEVSLSCESKCAGFRLHLRHLPFLSCLLFPPATRI